MGKERILKMVRIVEGEGTYNIPPPFHVLSRLLALSGDRLLLRRIRHYLACCSFACNEPARSPHVLGLDADTPPSVPRISSNSPRAAISRSAA